MQFPDDYAREVTAQGINSGVQNIVKEFKSTDFDDPVAQEFSKDHFFGDTFKGILSWRLPSHSASCPVSSFEYGGRVFTLDAHCRLIDDHFNVLNTAMYVVWLLLALFIVLRA
jgi:hypothetical protein